MNPRFALIRTTAFILLLVLSSIAHAQLTATITGTNISCNGGSNGSAKVTPSGGTTPYTYMWSPSGGTGATASGLSLGNYTCTIKDFSGTTINKSILITQPIALSATQSQINPLCYGDVTGSAKVTPAGGTTPYTYDWQPGNPTGDGTNTASNLSSTSYDCYITDANNCLLKKTFVIVAPPQLSISLTSQTNVLCKGASTGGITASVNGGSPMYNYNWTPGNPSGDGTQTISNLTAGTYTLNITDIDNCTKAQSFTITEPSTAISSSLGPPMSACNGVPNGSAIVNGSGGTGSLSYSWSPYGGSSNFGTNLGAGSYTVTITDANLCTKNQAVTVTSIAATQTGSMAGTAGGGLVAQTGDVSNASGYYVDGGCNLIARLQPSGVSPVSGNVSSELWIEPSVPTYSHIPYVARHYEITPATNATTSTGTVTLYFLQSEFDDYNALAGSLPKLPTGPSDATGIANIHIDKYAGTSSDGSGLPGTYVTPHTFIDPNDADIVWNATQGRWEVTLNVTGFGGFFVNSASFSLPITLVSFIAARNNGEVILKWQTSSEENSDHFIVEYSTDAKRFSEIGKVAAASNSSTVHEYGFVHTTPLNGTNYYRLRSVDIDGRQQYSDLRRIDLNDTGNRFSILQNPVNNGQLKLQFNEASTLTIYNTMGQVIWQQVVSPGSQVIEVNVPHGVYWLKAGGTVKKCMVN